jgi:hypothetical protein
MKLNSETDPNMLVGDIEMHATISHMNRQAFIDTIDTATSHGLDVVLFVIRKREVPPEIRRNPRVTVAEVQLGEVRLP